MTGVRSRLLALLLIASIPVLVTAVASAWEGYRRGLADLSDAATLLREAEAARHGVALADLRIMLLALADMPSMSRTDCDERLIEINRLFQGRYGNIWMNDAAGALRCDARGSPPGRVADAAGLSEALAKGADYVVGPFIPGRVTGRLVLPAMAAIRVDGRLVGQASAALMTDWFAQPDGRQIPAEAAHDTWLMDGAGGSFAVAGQSDSRLPDAALLLGWRQANRPVTAMATSRGGAELVYSWRPVRDGVSVLVALPADEAMAEGAARFRWRLGELLAQIVLCMLALGLGAEMTCARPMRRLAAGLRDWHPGQDFTPPRGPWDPWEVSALGSALGDAAGGIARRETALRAMVAERDRMLGEIHHRVKNSLQVAASMLSLQAAFVADPTARDEISTAHERVQTLALLHRHLYATAELSDVAMAPLLRDVAALLLNGMAVPWSVDAQGETLEVEQATPLAMLLAEALQLARGGGAGMRVEIVLRASGAMMTLAVHVHGRRAAAPVGGPSSLGVAAALMQGFAEQLGAALPSQAMLGEGLEISFPVLKDGLGPQSNTRDDAGL